MANAKRIEALQYGPADDAVNPEPSADEVLGGLVAQRSDPFVIAADLGPIGPRDDEEEMLDEVACRMGRDPRRARAVREAALREEAEALAREDEEAAELESERREREAEQQRAVLAWVASGVLP